MRKFKVGDIVRLREDSRYNCPSSHQIKVNKDYEIIKVRNGSALSYLVAEIGSRDMINCYSDSDLELSEHYYLDRRIDSIINKLEKICIE